MTKFVDRADAGRQLARRLDYLRSEPVVILGLPRGGVRVAFEVAKALDAPLDVIIVRKLGFPRQPELAMGAIGEGGARIHNADLLARSRVSEQEVRTVEAREAIRLQERVTRLRPGRARVDLHGRVAVIVDDGIATGSTARVACMVARQLGATKVVLAAPVAPADAVRGLPGADEVVCVSTPAHFVGVGCHYRDFSQTTDDEVVDLLDAAARRLQQRDRPAGSSG
jgi:putative phosphoribosyl transferase